MKSLITAVRANDMEEMLAILGPGSRELVFSGDDVADSTGREKFLKAYDRMNIPSKSVSRQSDALYRQGQLALADPHCEGR